MFAPPSFLRIPGFRLTAGKLQCRGLGASIEAWDDGGNAVWNRVGEPGADCADALYAR